MSLISIQNLHLQFDGAPIFEGAQFSIDKKEKVCLLGRNGTGKSTFFKVLIGEEPYDQGDYIKAQGLEICYLKQEVPTQLKGNLFEILLDGLGPDGRVLIEYHEATEKVEQSQSSDALKQLEKLQNTIEEKNLWNLDHLAESILTRLELDPKLEVSELSAGMKRRVLLGQALMKKPDLLLLDEPTNHLDLNSIEWLEKFIQQIEQSVMFITHDRRFLKNVATRIIELDRGKMINYPCTYSEYLIRREAHLDAEKKQNALFDKKLAQEEVWIRQGIKARRTRNEGRVRALKKLREERQQRRDQPKQVKLNLQEADTSGQKVITLKNISHQYNSTSLFQNFNTTIYKGDRIGLVGPNGSGKTTLLKIMLGALQPTQGQVELGTNLEIAYFDQLHLQLDESKSLMQNIVADEHVVIQGKRKHILGYLQDFLFPPYKSRGPIQKLSGGEKNRLLLAKLFSQPSNLLVLDEPTNDLDSDTLELLIEQLMNFSGTVLVVSHDRDFLNQVCTATFAFDTPGQLNEYIGGYDEWILQRPQLTKEAPTPKNKPSKNDPSLQKEMNRTMKKIEQLEKKQHEIHELMNDSEYYNKDPKVIEKDTQKLKTIEEDISKLYVAWEDLEAKL